jgi:hypothetical protein
MLGHGDLLASWRRMAVALLTAAVSLLPIACGGDEAAMDATLTNDGCTYHGDTSPTAGMFTIEVENQTEPERPVRCLPTSPRAHTPSCALSTTFPSSRFTSRCSWT